MIRRGGIQLDPNENVVLDFADSDLNLDLSVPSEVQWVKEKNYNTEIGLRFLPGPLLPGTLLDQYLDQPLAVREGS